MAKSIQLLSFLVLILIVSCSDESDSNFVLKGKIDGLKKGKVYLQKDGDSTIVNLDSMQIVGEREFTLQTNIEEPILLYLKLFKNDGQEHFIPFFADKGLTEIHTTLKNFNYDAEIKGSEQQKVLEEFTKVMSKYNNERLDLIQASFLAQKDKDSVAVDSLAKRSETLIKRKYSYTIQFAINNKDSEVAPYLTLYEIPSANPVYIDSIYNSLISEVKNSFYGKKLHNFISQRDSLK